MNLYLITGTTRGLGAAMLAQVAATPGNLAICMSRGADSAATPANVHVDLGDTGSIAPAFDRVMAMLAGRQFESAVLINNAGVVVPVERFDHLDPALTATNINVNLVAPLLLTRLFAERTAGMAARRLVVNISSGAAKRAIAGWSAYCAAKAGLEMATRVAALEASEGLSICSLAPGVIDTPMQAVVRGVASEAFPDVARFQAMKADGVLRDADEVARDIIALCASGKLTNGGNFDIREMKA
jgi:benzil reductase ((S)-benzoin forming)